MKKFISLLLATAMLMAVALTGCSGGGGDSTSGSDSTSAPSNDTTTSSDTEQTATSGGSSGSAPAVLNAGSTNTLGCLLPYSSVGENGAGLFLVYDMIFYYDVNDELQSDIIESYSFSDDGFAVNLKLREDVVFSNGDPATGEDLLFTLASTQDPDRQAVTTSFDQFDFDNSYVEDDGYTVVLKTYNTATAASQFPNLSQVALLDKSWCEEVGWDSEAWYNGPVGSGAYTVTDYLTGNHYTFTLRDDYWLDISDRSYPGVINFTAYSEEATMYMDLESGALAVAVEPASNDLERAMADDSDNIDYVFVNGNVCDWMVFDYEGSMSDINIRKAVAHGINWDDVAQAGKGVKYEEATSTIPSYFPAYVNVGQYEYDPDYAKECLAEAGYSTDNPLTLTMYVGPNDGNIATATVMQAELAQIGINLEFESYEMATVVPMWIAGDGDLTSFAMQGGSMAHDAYWVFKDLSSTATMGDNQTLSDTTIDDLLAKALLATTTEEANEYYAEIQQWVYDNYRVVSYMEEVNAVCYDTDVVTSIHIPSKDYPDLRFLTYAA
jgi:ABC-type transport system substrate-binding protein